MGQAGVNCYDCHKAEKKTDKTPGDPDGYDHRGFWIATLVSPQRLFPLPQGTVRTAAGLAPCQGGGHSEFF